MQLLITMKGVEWESSSALQSYLNSKEFLYLTGAIAVLGELKEQKIEFGYEDTTIEYTIPEKKSKYTVDFTLPNGILVETKGRWVAADRQKHLLIKKQHPSFQGIENLLSRAYKEIKIAEANLIIDQQ